MQLDDIFNDNKKEEIEIMISNASNIFDKLKSDGIKEGIYLPSSYLLINL